MARAGVYGQDRLDPTSVQLYSRKSAAFRPDALNGIPMVWRSTYGLLRRGIALGNEDRRFRTEATRFEMQDVIVRLLHANGARTTRGRATATHHITTVGGEFPNSVATLACAATDALVGCALDRDLQISGRLGIDPFDDT